MQYEFGICMVRGSVMKQEIDKSNVFVVDSDENICILSHVLQLQHKHFENKMLFISSKESSSIKGNFQYLKDKLNNFDDIYSRLKFLFLKESWQNLNERYGSSFFKNELNEIIQQDEVGVIYFHHIDLFFDDLATHDIHVIVNDIIRLVKYHHKKIIFSYSSKLRLGTVLDDLMQEFVDITYHITKNSEQVCVSEIFFHKKSVVNLLLLTQDPLLVKFHSYIFDCLGLVNFLHLDELTNENKDKLYKADIIVYHLDDDKLKNMLLEWNNHKKVKSKLFQLSFENLHRKQDKIMKLQSGFDHIFEQNFDLLDYLFHIENSVKDNFYTKKMEFLPVLKNSIIFDEVVFKGQIVDFIDKEIFFSIVVIYYESRYKIELSHLEEFIRENDYIYFDAGESRIVFLMLNMLPTTAYMLLKARLEKSHIYIKKHQLHCVNDLYPTISHKKETVHAN